jgi:hypothetical protein
MADFSQDKKYNKLWRRSSFDTTIFEGNKISELANDSKFLNQEQANKLYPSSQSFSELNEVAIRSTTNFYIVNDFVDEYFDDVDEFFKTYNTGSFTGSFEGTISIQNVLTLNPIDELPTSPPPSSLATMVNIDERTTSLYFFNGDEWVLIV